MALFVLPNGNAINTDDITAVVLLRANGYAEVAGMKAMNFPDRVRIDYGERNCQLIEFANYEDAVSFRDEVIKAANSKEGK